MLCIMHLVEECALSSCWFIMGLLILMSSRKSYTDQEKEFAFEHAAAVNTYVGSKEYTVIACGHLLYMSANCDITQWP